MTVGYEPGPVSCGVQRGLMVDGPDFRRIGMAGQPVGR